MEGSRDYMTCDITKQNEEPDVEFQLFSIKPNIKEIFLKCESIPFLLFFFIFGNIGFFKKMFYANICFLFS